MGHETYTNASKGSYTGAGGHGAGGFSSDFSGFGDIFDFFGGNQRRSGPQPGADLLMRMQLTLEEAVAGLTRRLKSCTARPVLHVRDLVARQKRQMSARTAVAADRCARPHSRYSASLSG